jgi:hypothetical protein
MNTDSETDTLQSVLYRPLAVTLHGKPLAAGSFDHPINAGSFLQRLAVLPNTRRY